MLSSLCLLLSASCSISLSASTPRVSTSSFGSRLSVSPPLSRRRALSALPALVLSVPSASRAVTPPPLPPPPPTAAQEFWSGLLAGGAQKTVKELLLHPLDTAKARLQLAGGRRAVLSELFAKPYDGVLPALLAGAPAASVFFAVKDATKRRIEPFALGAGGTTLAAVASANVAYWAIKNPSEVLKVRRQAGVAEDTLAAAADIWRKEGLRGFYSSVVPNYAYSTPVDCIKFLLYEGLKAELKARRGGASLTSVETAVGGAIAASTAQALATPLDVARVRIMTSNATGVINTIRTVLANEGFGALYSGVTPKVARALASGAIQFSTYEAIKEWTTRFLSRTFPDL
ncbi:hypothetical protein AB1Y20_011466 [Prymnesium parvum]|uniref:Mitochondrial carrier protein n=1 Tax=Prymnesium parvum TaxID=97485 RepID=A0AB34IN94_PRYPA